MAAAHHHRNRSASHHFAVRESRLRRESVNAALCGRWTSKAALAEMLFAGR